MYKSQLQEYAQKAGLLAPTYDHVKEGASHEPRFKSTVWVNNLIYESAPGFLTVRAAEHAAAKVALDFLQKNQASGVTPSAVHESGLCKNLLQEYAQKHGNPLPQYRIMRQGKDHLLTFSATVEIAGVSYSGGFAKSKKEAEIKAARTALMAIQATEPASNGSPVVEFPPLPDQALPQITNFIKAHPRKKKRGRQNAASGEPMATRLKQGLGFIPGPVQAPQMYQIPQVPQVAPIHLQQAQIYPGPVNPVGYPGENVIPVQWNQELGVCTRPAVPFSEPMQVGQVVAQDPAMTKFEPVTIPAASVQETAPTLAVLETAPTLAVQETAPTLAVQETAPTLAVQETAPTPAVQETAPTLAVQETAPTLAVHETAPTLAVQETAPTLAVLETAPTLAVQETAPTLAVQETAPTLAVQETTPTLAVQETAPTLAVQETTPTPVQETAPTLVTETMVVGAPGVTAAAEVVTVAP